jgi:hypothetical protein
MIRDRVGNRLTVAAVLVMIGLLSAWSTAYANGASAPVYDGVPNPGGLYRECVNIAVADSSGYGYLPPKTAAIWANSNTSNTCTSAFGRPKGWLEVSTAAFTGPYNFIGCGSAVSASNATNGSSAVTATANLTGCSAFPWLAAIGSYRHPSFCCQQGTNSTNRVQIV